MVCSVCIDKIKTAAEENYRSIGMTCSESVVAAIRDYLDPSIPVSLVAAASGFGGGVGRSKCMCGTVSGAVIVLGYYFGRGMTEGNSRKCLDLAAEVQDGFRQNHKGVLCCHVQTRGMDMASEQRKCQCISFTGEMASATARIIARELNLSIVSEESTTSKNDKDIL